MKKTYTMTPAAKAARMKGSKATADKFARLRAGRDRSTAVVDKALKNWAIDRFGNQNQLISHDQYGRGGQGGKGMTGNAAGNGRDGTNKLGETITINGKTGRTGYGSDPVSNYAHPGGGGVPPRQRRLSRHGPHGAGLGGSVLLLQKVHRGIHAAGQGKRLGGSPARRDHRAE